ncbi:hypothetical protein F2Q68_00043691 [Brassica cretica]|uniref:malate dehydrogenase n=1 Tax=Brassica cretica TaxID=69181 RepID=A0A8S9LSN1_BRACR|nr:hypothetical protein F2Q68_00043691 [Brassica cretica]
MAASSSCHSYFSVTPLFGSNLPHFSSPRRTSLLVNRRSFSITATMASSHTKKVLIPVAHGTEPFEAVVMIDVLRRGGADVTVASVENQVGVDACHGIKMVADTLLSDITDSVFDLIMLPVQVNVPVIGGHAGVTILPLFSQATPQANLSADVLTALTKRTQDGGTEVVEAKAGKGSATLSMAYAGALFADACLKGLNGVPDVVECSYVQSTITELPFFASKVRLGKNGVEEVLDLGPLSDFEKEGLEALKPELKSSIEKGVKFANQ